MRRPNLALLLVTTALGSLSAKSAAFAADAAPAQPPVFDEVVVTATKQSATVNRVPLSITAVTAKGIEEQAIKSMQDLSRIVPALQISTSNTPNGANVSIRGIYSTVGASTTAVYLDDVPLQRRTTLGAFSGSGDIFPQLFDLERVEVLRGPQGTLYGGSAEGGAVRFITPTPSLTKYSAQARVEGSSTAGGGGNDEFAFAVGGPLMADKLGFRGSGYYRQDSGYISHVSPNTGATYATGTNTAYNTAVRGALLWAPLDKLTVTASGYNSREHHEDADSFWQNVAATSVPTVSYTATGAVATGSNGPINYTLPAHTYGPWNFFGPNKTGAGCNIGANYAGVIPPCYEGSPRTSALTTAGLTVAYDLGMVKANFTSSYVIDTNKGQNDGSVGELSGYQSGVPFIYTMPVFYGRAIYKNRRNGVTEELRLSSQPTSWLTWVAGAFYSYQYTHVESHDFTSDGAAASYLRGVPDVLVYGAPVAANGDITARYQWLKERELAGFGEANVFVTPKLKLIIGGRYSQETFGYNTMLAGAFFGYATPTAANGGLSAGSQTQGVFLPKFGAQYNLTDADSLYLTASKGFRMGGVNTGPFQSKCASTFAALGISGTPLQYNSDSLWSYEFGGKARILGGRAQINASLFYIDWSNVQVNYTLPAPCGFSYTTNAGGAVSKGGDVQAQVKIAGGLSASLLASYTDAYYSSALIGPPPTNSIFIRKGDTLPIPGFTGNIGLRYDFSAANHAGYVRIDYQYTGAYKRGFGPGSSSYDADTYDAGETRYVSGRAAVDIKALEVSLFVQNLFNSQDIMGLTGGRACTNLSCSTFRSNNPVFAATTFRPRTAGVTLSYSY